MQSAAAEAEARTDLVQPPASLQASPPASSLEVRTHPGQRAAAPSSGLVRDEQSGTLMAAPHGEPGVWDQEPGGQNVLLSASSSVTTMCRASLGSQQAVQEAAPQEAWKKTDLGTQAPAVPYECGAALTESLTRHVIDADLNLRPEANTSNEAAAGTHESGGCWPGRSQDAGIACGEVHHAEALKNGNSGNNQHKQNKQDSINNHDHVNSENKNIGNSDNNKSENSVNGLINNQALDSDCATNRRRHRSSSVRDDSTAGGSVLRSITQEDGVSPRCSSPDAITVWEQPAMFAQFKLAADAAAATFSAASRLRSPSPSPRARPWYSLGLQHGGAGASTGGRGRSILPLTGEEEEEEEDFGFVHLEKHDAMSPSATESDGWMHVSCAPDNGPAEPMVRQCRGRPVLRPAEAPETSARSVRTLQEAEDEWEWHWDNDLPTKPLGLDYLREVLAALAQDPTGPRMHLSQAMAPSKEERIVVDQAARVQHVNNAWQRKFGFLRNEVVGTLLSAFQAEQLCRCMQIVPLVQDGNQKDVQVFLARVEQGPLQDDDVLYDL